MNIENDRLRLLVEKLDSLGHKPSLIDLASALKSVQLHLSDVQAYVQTNPHSYNRATVILRDQYEILVMTWTGGQASVPHDHGGSICAMLTVSGQSVEGNYTVAADGYVDLEYENVFGPDEVTAGQDAGVHTISNEGPPDSVMVTVHIYSPPLRDFRRFTKRPKMVDPALEQNRADIPVVAVVGGGVSGSISAAQLLRHAKQSQANVRVVLLEQRGSIGEGLAYSSQEECHLLNVPAGRMSAWPDQPDDFVQWAATRYGEISPDDFLPRKWYGEYIRQTVLRTATQAEDPAALSVVFDEARRISRHPEGGWIINLARGTSVRSDIVLLAIGHRAPSDPLGQKWVGPRTRFVSDPWKPFAMNAIGANDAVLILGSGLTAVDAVMSLANRQHLGPITLVSRRGLLPQPHLAGHGTPVDLNKMVADLTGGALPVRALELFRKLRDRAAEAVENSKPWQLVIDGLRPHISLLWSKMPMSERRRFLTHLRSYWEVHRHRMPVPVAGRFSEMLKTGDVQIFRGRADSVIADVEQLKVVLRERHAGLKREVSCQWIVNATGPSPSNSAASNPAIGSLLLQGLLSPDELNLGVQTTREGNLIGADGKTVSDLFVVGTLRKPDLWESTAVPELRAQAANAAQSILKMLMLRN